MNLQLQLRHVSTVISLLTIVICGCSQTQRSTEQISGTTMGTSYQVKYLPGSTSPKLVELAKLIDQELTAVNLQMSTYQDDSELYQFNASSSVQWQPMSNQVIDVVRIGKQFHQLSDGYFDITVGPLVNMWGFGPDPEPNKTPKEFEIRSLLETVGSDKIEIRSEPPSLKKSNPNTKLDLSAIAKGHGVDRVSILLEKYGVENYFVEVGGEIRVSGSRLDGQPWQLGIEQPNPRSRELHRVVGMKAGAMATSGNYRNFYELDGKRITHFINPKTGLPMESNLLSASVIMDECASADAAATTLMVLGTDAAKTLIAEQKWAAMLIIENHGKLETFTSPQFESRIIQ